MKNLKNIKITLNPNFKITVKDYVLKVEHPYDYFFIADIEKIYNKVCVAGYTIKFSSYLEIREDAKVIYFLGYQTNSSLYNSNQGSLNFKKHKKRSKIIKKLIDIALGANSNKLYDSSKIK